MRLVCASHTASLSTPRIVSRRCGEFRRKRDAGHRVVNKPRLKAGSSRRSARQASEQLWSVRTLHEGGRQTLAVSRSGFGSTETACLVVVHKTASLHPGVDDDWAHELESALLERRG
jgi:hypothetical protein